jgi:hypothetical protein
MIFIVSIPVPAHAHKVNIYAYEEGGKVYVEGYFNDGKPCMNSMVEALDASTGEKLSEVKTDTQGKVVLKSFKGHRLKLVLNAGMGHGTQYVMEAANEAVARPERRPSRPRASQILVGIGCIAGLFGLLMYYKSKHRK